LVWNRRAKSTSAVDWNVFTSMKRRRSDAR
jgi:hypothetical protein